MLSRIHTFLDADSLEIRFPEFLKDLLVLIHQTLVQHARNQMSGLAVVMVMAPRLLVFSTIYTSLSEVSTYMQ